MNFSTSAGNAGLRLLSQIRFDIVKIDLSLVQVGVLEESSRAVLRALRDLEDRWEATIIAEEFNAQAPWLNYSAIETLKAFSPKVHGVTDSHRNYLYFEKAWMEK